MFVLAKIERQFERTTKWLYRSARFLCADVDEYDRELRETVTERAGHATGRAREGGERPGQKEQRLAPERRRDAPEGGHGAQRRRETVRRLS